MSFELNRHWDTEVLQFTNHSRESTRGSCNTRTKYRQCKLWCKTPAKSTLELISGQLHWTSFIWFDPNLWFGDFQSDDYHYTTMSDDKIKLVDFRPQSQILMTSCVDRAKRLRVTDFFRATSLWQWTWSVFMMYHKVHLLIYIYLFLPCGSYTTAMTNLRLESLNTKWFTAYTIRNSILQNYKSSTKREDINLTILAAGLWLCTSTEAGWGPLIKRVWVTVPPPGVASKGKG